MNFIFTYMLPYLPKWFSKPFAKPYVAGETTEDALSHIKKLNRRGFSATLDILGEYTSKVDIARDITDQYCQLYDEINNRTLECTISVKPTHVGLSISDSEAMRNMVKIAKKAKEYENFLRIDMESSHYTDKTFEIYRECKTITKDIGVVLQSYLYRSLDDISNLVDSNFNTRICKGIYKEDESIAYQSKEEIRKNFLLMAKTVANKGGFSGFATHDHYLIDRLLDWIEKDNISKHLFEFQVLYGVPMGGRLKELVSKGYSVRIYVPFGPDWFEYSIRRLKENPNIASYVLKNLFKR